MVTSDDLTRRGRASSRFRDLLSRPPHHNGKDHSGQLPRLEAAENPEPRPLDEVIGDCGLYEEGLRRPGRIPLDQVQDVVRHTSGFVWIGLQQATLTEIMAVADELGLPDLAVEDAVKAHQRPKLEVYGDIVFLVLKPVHYIDHEEVIELAEIAMFVGPGFVVTVRHGESSILTQVRHELDHGFPEFEDLGVAAVLYRTADLVVDGYEEAIAFIDEDVDEIETQVFASLDADDNSERIYKLKREIAEFRRAVLPLTTPLQRLADGAVSGINPSTAHFFRDVHDHVMRVADAIEGHDRLLTDVLQADMSRVAARQSQISVRQNEIAVQQNQDMRKISAWAAIALVPTAVAAIYGMNFDNMPELKWKYGYFIVVGLIGGACVGLYALFRRKKWL